jgi:hypothetical protein
MLSIKERALRLAGSVVIGGFTLTAAWLFVWALCNGGAALAHVRGSGELYGVAVLGFGLVGYSVSLFAIAVIVGGLLFTLREWFGVFDDMVKRRQWARGNGGRHEN